jgi:hypothetical protein
MREHGPPTSAPASNTRMRTCTTAAISDTANPRRNVVCRMPARKNAPITAVINPDASLLSTNMPTAAPTITRMMTANSDGQKPVRFAPTTRAPTITGMTPTHTVSAARISNPIMSRFPLG